MKPTYSQTTETNQENTAAEQHHLIFHRAIFCREDSHFARKKGVTAGGCKAADAVLFEVIGDWAPFTEMIKRSSEHNNHYACVVSKRTSEDVCLYNRILCVYCVYMYMQLIPTLTARAVNHNHTT